MKKYILVTGGAGFIGSNFIKIALELNPSWHILNLDLLTYCGTPRNLDNISDISRYTFIYGDIGDIELLESIFRKYQISAIFNFAAETHVDRSIDNSLPFINTNIVGTYWLLEACRLYYNKSNPFRFIHISTDEVYGSLGDTGKFTETSQHNPSSPYSASKSSSEALVRSFFHTYGLPIIITNCSNNYGPNQYSEKLIPMVINSILNKKEIPVYGNGKNIRDWLYVIDHCEALLSIYDNGIPGENYNIGGGVELSNIEIINVIYDIIYGIYPDLKLNIKFVDDRLGHDYRYSIDCNKINNTLYWSSRFKFNTAIKDTIFWYINNL